MSEINDTNAKATGPAEKSESGSSPAKKGSRLDLDPIFVSYIYDFVGTEPQTALSGDGTGKPGTICGPINEHPPKFRVFTYPFIPFRGDDIANT